MGVVLVTPAAAYPVSLEEAKSHLRVGFPDDDDLIEALLQASIGYAESFTGRAFIDQTFDLFLDAFPTDGAAIRLPNPPLIEVTGIYYRDSNGDEQEFASSSYLCDTSPNDKARVQLAYGANWPTIQDRINAVRIRYRAGYLKPLSPSEAGVPQAICAAIKIILANLYEHRESVVIGQSAVEMPWSAMQLLRRYRVHTAMG